MRSLFKCAVVPSNSTDSCSVSAIHMELSNNYETNKQTRNRNTYMDKLKIVRLNVTKLGLLEKVSL